MTLKEQLVFISDTFESGLPAKLATAGLDNFDEYVPHKELRSTDLELCVYLDVNNDSTDKESTSFIVKAQLYHKDEGVDYADVIKPFIKEFITPKSLGYTNRDSLILDFNALAVAKLFSKELDVILAYILAFESIIFSAFF